MDVTNAGIPQAGGQLSGESARAAAIRRMQKLQQNLGAQSAPKPGFQPPVPGPNPLKPKRGEF